MNLLQESVNVILKNQTPYGSFVASPTFKTYQFSWIRDGSFIAYSLDAAKRYDEAEKFYNWVDDVIKKHESKMYAVLKSLANGEKIQKKDFFNARFTLEGSDEKDTGWGNFQLDAYGTWLWALSRHIKATGRTQLLDEFAKSIDLTVRYLQNLWFYPNYDIWEENSDKIHTSTLSCLFGGLNSINEYLKSGRIRETAENIRSFIMTNCVKDETFVKYVGSDDVDASLLWLAVPFGVVKPDNTIFVNTVHKIEKDLLKGQGLHRYKKDTYYGGGEWPLLSCWLGWYYAVTGSREKAEEILKWVEGLADEHGYLPEQATDDMNDASFYNGWVEKWGKPASPLLWSHAMYIVLHEALNR